MPLPSLQTTFTSLLPHSTPHQSLKNDPTPAPLLPKTHHRYLRLLPQESQWGCSSSTRARRLSVLIPRASLLETPVLWVGRVCIFYALLKAGLAGSQSNPLVSDLEAGVDDLGFSKWLENLQKNPDKEAADKRKLVSKWHPTTKGTLRRNYRVSSKSEGKRLLKALASLLSDDDNFRDATSHKGCQIRRESAHGESVCCNNVRALFDELPTPHLLVEISAFPAGPLTEKDYAKAGKLEKVLRSSPSV